MTASSDWFLDVICVVLVVLIGLLLIGKLRQRRPEAFIRSYVFPPSVIDEFAKHYPDIDAGGREKVAKGLRQFFLVRLRAGVRLIGMPSRVVDDLWHEFILDTRATKDLAARLRDRGCLFVRSVEVATAVRDRYGTADSRRSLIHQLAVAPAATLRHRR